MQRQLHSNHKQVKSSAKEGRPAKLQLRAKGPCRVTAPTTHEETNDSCWVQAKPSTMPTMNAKSKLTKERAFHMEKLPSHLAVHKRANTPDTRLVRMTQSLVHNPMEHNLGMPDFGKHAQEQGENTAFVKAHDMWETEATEPDSDSDEDNDELTDTEEKEMQRIRQTQQRRRKNDKHSRQVTIAETIPTKLAKQILHQNTKESKQKLFIIAQKEQDEHNVKWHATQVDMELTNSKSAKTKGQHHCKWHCAKVQDAENKTHDQCSCWPLMKELAPSGWFGPTVPTKPSEVAAELAKQPNELGWHQKPVNLAEDATCRVAERSFFFDVCSMFKKFLNVCSNNVH